MAGALEPRPPNLTLLSRANAGFFPYGEVFDTIDGRDEVAVHGPRQMPVWGNAFLPRGNSHGTEDELVVYGRILALVRYLESLQVELLRRPRPEIRDAPEPELFRAAPLS